MATNKRLIKSNDEGGGGGGTSFNTVLYTGNGGTQSVAGVGFQPDLVWVKNRDNGTRIHKLFDSVRGVQKFISSNTTAAEVTDTNALESFDIDGYTTGSDGSLNTSGENYVAWCWKAGGAAVTNNDGTITSQVSANVAAGFSIVNYTGTGSAATVGHGLSDAPKIIIVKGRTFADHWVVYSDVVGLNGTLLLNSYNSVVALSNYWGTANPTSNVFSLSTYAQNNTSSANFIAYCFAEVAGFSKISSYVGTGTTNNPTIDCGFEPAFVMIKCTSISMNWAIFDNKRDITNPNEAILYPNLSIAETNTSGSGINFLSNGFQLNSNSGGWINESGRTFIYMAFANQF